MRKNEFEDKMLQEINRIDEGLALGILKLFFKPAVRRAFKTIKKNNPDLFSKVDSLDYLSNDIQDHIKRMKKEAKNGDEAAIESLKAMGVKF